MSPTLLEFVVGIILLVVAWQIGVAIAPDVFRWLGRLRGEIDSVANDAEEETQLLSKGSSEKEHRNGTHR